MILNRTQGHQMRNGNKSNVVGELGLVVGVLFVAACVGVGSTSPCGYFPFWEIIGATGALLSLRRSKVAKVIGLGVAFLIIALYLWGLRDYLHLLGEGRFQEFFDGERFVGQGRVERWRMDCQGLAMKSLFMQSLLFLAVAIFLSSCGGTSIRTSENATSARVMNLVNQERAKRGLGRVVPDGGLRQVAAGHAGFLERNVSPLSGRPSKSMAHYGFQERAKMARERNYLVLSEVVMIGYAGDLSAVAERTIQGWLSSPSHRKAILNPDRRIMGIETRLPADGRYFVVGLLSNGRFKQAQTVVEIKR